jgi:hypothetical protein
MTTGGIEVAASKSRREAVQIIPLAVSIRPERFEKAQIRNAVLGSELRDALCGIVKFRDLESTSGGPPLVLAW